MAAIVRPNQAHAPSHDPRPHAGRAQRPRLTMVQGGRSPEVLAAAYRRRRLAALVVTMMVAFGLLLLGRTVALAVAPAAPGSGPAVAPAGEVTDAVVVQPGDTLWAMARRMQPEGDVRPLVDRLADAHGPGPLQPGEVVQVSVDPG